VNIKGTVLSVDVVVAGVDVLETVAAGATEVVGVDAVDLPADGGHVVLPDGSTVHYVSADHDTDTVVLAGPLPVGVDEGDRLLLSPVSSYRQAVVHLDDGGEVIPVRVPHVAQPSLPVGVREDGGGEFVSIAHRDGASWVADVFDRPPLEVWGDPDGVATEMRDTGLRAYTVGPAGRYEASRFGSGGDRLGIFNAEGQITAGITADGRVVGQAGAIAGDLSVGGVPLMGRLWDNSPGAPTGWMERFAAGDVAAVNFTEQSPVRPAGQEFGYAKVGFTARAGRSYVVSVTSVARTVNIAGGIRSRLRYTTGGAEPTVTSPDISSDYSPSSVQGSYWMSMATRGRLSFSNDTSVVVMFTAEGLGSAESQVARAYFEVQDLGPQGVYGGGTYTTGREATPPPTVREYTSTWTATGFRVYDESGQPVADATEPRQYGDPTGRRDYSAIAFTGPATSGSDVGLSMTDAKAGATLTRAEVFIANSSWGGADAGHVALGKGSLADLPPTLAPQATVNRLMPTGAGMWFEVLVSWFSDTNRVVTLGDVDGGVQGGWFMAPGDDFPPQVRLTYTR